MRNPEVFFFLMGNNGNYPIERENGGGGKLPKRGS